MSLLYKGKNNNKARKINAQSNNPRSHTEAARKYNIQNRQQIKEKNRILNIWSD